MSIILIIALALPVLGVTLLIWPCLLMAAWSDEKMPSPPDLD